MTPRVQKAVEALFIGASQRDMDIPQFIASHGLDTMLVHPASLRSPILISEGQSGTVVPLIRTALGVEVAYRILPRYFEGQGDFLFVKEFEITRLPEMELVGSEWVVRQKGRIDHI